MYVEVPLEARTVSDPLELKLQVAVNYLMCVPLLQEKVTLTTEPFLQPHMMDLNKPGSTN